MALLRCTITLILFERAVLSPSVGRKRDKMLTAKLNRWFRAWTRYRQSLRELDQLDDRELADIGISRSEIRDIAWHDARR